MKGSESAQIPTSLESGKEHVKPISVGLIGVYEMGRQPFGIASPAAWLRRAGMSVYTCDLAVESIDDNILERLDLIAIHLPMHTATRLAVEVLPSIRKTNPHAALCFYGLYAAPNETYLRSLGADLLLGGEYEERLVTFAESLRTPNQVRRDHSVISLDRQLFVQPDRTGLPSPDNYARLIDDGQEKLVGYTEASRGCRHTCRHCPVVPVYEGRFVVVQRDVVLSDIVAQVANGAQHITFGDPDFFNGPVHAMAIVDALHEQFPDLTYDVTIKIEHLLKYDHLVERLLQTGCLFVTTAVEAIDEPTLDALQKGHTAQDFELVVRRFQSIGLHLNSTFVAFTPWTTLASYRDLIDTVDRLGLVDSISPIQYSIRLLIVSGSKLLDLASVQDVIEPFEASKLVYPWTHENPAVDQLQQDVLTEVELGIEAGLSRSDLFDNIRSLVWRTAGCDHEYVPVSAAPPTAPVPYLTEPWYC